MLGKNAKATVGREFCFGMQTASLQILVQIRKISWFPQSQTTFSIHSHTMDGSSIVTLLTNGAASSPTFLSTTVLSNAEKFGGQSQLVNY